MQWSVLVVLVLIPGYHASSEGYYWREYFGRVPADAIVAGKNDDGKSVYVGQGYIKNGGLSVGTITEGVKKLCFPYEGSCTPSKYVKILCGFEDNFHWLNANATHLHVLIRDYHPVIGGHDDKQGYLNVGRISQNGVTIVGKVASSWIGKATVFYGSNGTELSSTSYAVLVYRNSIMEVGGGFYWREYFGRVPSDAVIAGRNPDGNSVYIGQGYIKNGGLSVGTINPKIKNVCFPHAGTCTTTKYVKILCGVQDHFYWLNANATHLHVLIADHYPVVGGLDEKTGYLNIGRISENGDIKVGKVSPGMIGNAKFFYTSNGTEHTAISYGMLFYNHNTAVDIRKGS